MLVEQINESRSWRIVVAGEGDERVEIATVCLAASGPNDAETALALYQSSLEPELPDLRAYASDKRWRVETGGIAFGGHVIATDDRSKMMLMGARILAAADSGHSERWACADGAVLTLDAAAIIAASDAVAAHVSACFATWAEVAAGIEAGTITTTEQIDTAEWPGA
jgi:hypothetical protein